MRKNGQITALASAYLHDVQGVFEDEAVVVCPVDPYVEDDYFETLKELGRPAETGESNLVLMGIEPTYPSEKYGYNIPDNKDMISKVSTFKENQMQRLQKHMYEREHFGTEASLHIN